MGVGASAGGQTESSNGAKGGAEAKTSKSSRETETPKRQLDQLRQELAATKEYLQSIIEELEATNENLQSANEEIQSAKEELNTVNDEMQHRNQQLSLLTNDLTNLLNSVNMAIVMVGPDLRIRRFTLQAEKMLGLSSVDVGRPLSSVRFKLDLRDLEQRALDVIRGIIAQQLPVVDENGKKHLMRITPYRSTDNKIEGVVLAMPESEIR